MILPITLTIAGACALIVIWLGVRVSRLRLQRKVAVGDGGDAVVLARMRAHANFTEYAPLFLVLLGLIELGIGSEPWLWGVAILFVIGRLIHAFGMDRPAPNPLRVGGMVLTWIPLLGLAVYALLLTYEGQQRGEEIHLSPVRSSSAEGGTKLS